MDADQYAYQVFWSPEDRAYVGTSPEFPSLSWISIEQTGALRGIRALVAEAVEDLQASGETPPQAIADRHD